VAFGANWLPARQWGELCIFHRGQQTRQDGGEAVKTGSDKMLLSKRVLSTTGNQDIYQRSGFRFVPDPHHWLDLINDDLANATHQFPCNQQSASACVDYDGKPTEVATCRFELLNRSF
jgi:hypothetical protein